MKHARKTFGIRRQIAAVFAAIGLVGCTPEEKIQLPENYAVPVSGQAGPVIDISNVDVQGQTSKATISSATAASPEIVVGIPASQQKPYSVVAVYGAAKDDALGVRYFRIRATRGTHVIAEAVANQFPDDQNKVYPTLGILGVGSGTSAGLTHPIEFPVTLEEDVVVSALAMNFGWAATSLEIRYHCPICYYPPGPNRGGGTGGGTGGTTGGTGGNQPAQRLAGAFVEVQPDVSGVGQTLASPNNTYTATIAVNPLDDPAQPRYPQIVTLKSGAKSKRVEFAVGSLTPSLPAIGGVNFTTDSTRAVVATFNKPILGLADHVSYVIVDLPKAFAAVNPDTVMSASISVKESDLSGANPNPQYVRPKIFFSPDSTLALVLSAPAAGAIGALYNLSAYDLKSGAMAHLLGATNISGEFGGAKVEGSKIKAMLVGGAPAAEFDIP